MQITHEMWDKFQVYLFVDRKISRNKSSLYAIRSRFNKLIAWFEGRDFNRDNLNLFIGEMHVAGAAKSYMNKMIALSKHIDKYLDINQLQDYTYFAETYQPKEILTPGEIEALAGITMPYSKHSEYVNARQKCLILLLGTTGSRIGEVLSLKWADLLSSPPHVVYRDTKNGDARAVPIGQSVYDLLVSLPRRSDYVFSSYRGGTLDQQQINLDVQWRASSLGIKKPVYNHIFRHSYITTMLEQGVDVSDVAKIVGHKNINSTMRYKNSLLNYYSTIVQLHPLLIADITLDLIKSNLKGMAEKLTNNNQYSVYTKETNRQFILKIQYL